MRSVPSPNPPSAKRKRSRSDNPRELVLQTALRLFTTRGYFNTSVHDIRREADISIGAIYHYFDSKEAIAKALFDETVERMSGELREIMERYATAHDRCRAVVGLLFDLTESSPEVMEFMLYAKHREFMPEEKPVCSSQPFTLMKSIVEEGIRTGELRSLDPLVASATLFGGPIRMIHLRLDGLLGEPLTEHLEEAWDCAWRSVKE